MKAWIGQHKKDLFLCLSMVLVVAFLLLCVKLSQKQGGYVVVTVDQKVVGKYPLQKDLEIKIDAHGGYNTLVVKDGFASIEDADCPDKLCTHQSKIQCQNETILCVPHLLLLTIEGEKAPVDFVIWIEKEWCA